MNIKSRQKPPDLSPNWARNAEPFSVRGLEGPEINIADLFCGCGGLSLGVFEGLIASGCKPKIAYAVDIDPISVDVFKSNFDVEEGRATSTDITNVISGRIGAPITDAEAKLVESVGLVDVVAAGPPCQGHSDLNNHTRRKDVRNSLYMRTVRFIELFRPSVAIIENVATVVHDRGRVVSRAKASLERLGYSVRSETLHATDFGVAQRRRRHFVVALRGSDVEEEIFSPVVHAVRNLGDWIKDLEDECGVYGDLFRNPSRLSAENIGRVRYLFENNLYDLPNELRPPCHKDKNHSYKSMYGRMSWKVPAQTLTGGFGSMGQGRFIHPSSPRLITPHEAARIQGFPDFFDFSNVKKRTVLHQLIGNAVPPQIAAALIFRVGSKLIEGASKKKVLNNEENQQRRSAKRRSAVA